MNVLELFSGTASFSKVARERGHECVTLDNEAKFAPDICMDIMDFEPSALDGFKPDIIWASPPCTHFSVASRGVNWRYNGNKTGFAPISSGAKQSMVMIQKLLGVIRVISPRYYFVENPRAMLREMPFMKGWPRTTVTYCKYGSPYQKPTDIWNNCLAWKPHPVCRPKAPCDLSSPQGSHNQRQEWSLSTAQERGIVPRQLCEEIIIACEVQDDIER